MIEERREEKIREMKGKKSKTNEEKKQERIQRRGINEKEEGEW